MPHIIVRTKSKIDSRVSGQVGKMEDNGQAVSEDTSRFLQLIAMFQLAALQQMGKLPNPVTNEVESDLKHAKASIDMLATLKKKTSGNLEGAEAEFLDKVLFELHMNYVDEVEREARETRGEGDKGNADGAGSEEETGEKPDEAPEEPGK
jgi:hypothetical protein